MIKKIIINRNNYGIGLVFTGLPIIWVIRTLTGASNSQLYSIVFMALSILITVDFTNVFKSSTDFLFIGYTDSFLKLTPLVYLFPACAASFLADIENDFGLIYLLFSIIFLIALDTISFEKLANFPQIFLISSGCGCIVVTIYLIASGAQLSGQRIVIGSTVSPGIIGFMASSAIVSGLFIFFCRTIISTEYFKIYALISVVCGFYIYLLSAARSPLIGMLLCLALSLTNLRYFVPSNRKINKNKKNYLSKKNKYVFSIFAFCLVLTGIKNLHSESDLISILRVYFDNFFTHIVRGYSTFVLGKGNEMSAAGRISLREYAINNLNTWGHGYKTQQLDFPLLQAFHDTGILGGLIFAFVALIIPTYLMINILYIKKVTSSLMILCFYLYIMIIPNLFLHGQPYDFYIWLRIILVYVIVSKYQKSFRY